jgi:energy-coupling factor transporter ATP-binding protein EcfA2
VKRSDAGMIKLIYGKKGSGKSKQLLDMANAEALDAKGNIIYIDDNNRCMYDLKHEIRFINISEYEINNVDSLYGFVCGLMSGDFDIHSFYIDGLKKILYKEDANIELLLSKLVKALKNVSAYIVYSSSGEVPDYLIKYIDAK